MLRTILFGARAPRLTTLKVRLPYRARDAQTNFKHLFFDSFAANIIFFFGHHKIMLYFYVM